MGRPPVPRLVKIQRGTLKRGQGGRPKPEPQHEPIAAGPPDEVAAEPVALAEWERLIEALSHGHCTEVDRSTLAAYCRAYAQWRKLLPLTTGDAIIHAPSGYPVANPAIAMCNKACLLMVKLAGELGITPSSRSRIVAMPYTPKPGAAVDPFTAFQRERRQKT